MWVDQVVTYLEMTHPAQLRPARPAPARIELDRVGPDAAPLVVDLVRRIGTPHHWPGLDRPLPEWTELLAGLWSGVLRIDGDAAGLLQLVPQPDGNVEISTFGVVPELVGRGHGGHALTLAVRQAWNTVDHDDLAPVRRVWLHTSSLDHPHALTNYRSRGFRPFWERRNRRELG